MFAPQTGSFGSSQSRAFLCHSSRDKAYVERVATKLYRSRVNYDSFTFEQGSTFLEAARKALSESQLFVLFASKSSLDSLWVDFEVEEAEELLRQDIIKSAVVITIDSRVQPSDLPKWMQRSLIEPLLSVSAATRLIEYHLNKLRGIQPDSLLFIGREKLVAEFAQRLTPAPEVVAPHIILLGGLSGVGRRSFLRRALPSTMSQRLGPIFSLEVTSGIDVLHSQLLDELGVLDTRADADLALTQFRNATLSEKGVTLANLFQSAALGNMVPVIVDEGGLLNSDTTYSVEALSLLEALAKLQDVTVCFVHTKRPNVDDAALMRLQAIYFKVPPLDLEATTLLLTRSLRNAGIAATSEQISELAPYLDGYPPAVNLAVSFAKEYGLDTTLADKSKLNDFKVRTFSSVLKALPLLDQDWAILRILASEVILPLEVLSAVLQADEVAVANRLRHLIDLNLVLPSASGFQLSRPIKAAVYSMAGGIKEEEYHAIANRLRGIFWHDSAQLPHIEIIIATVHAVSRSDTKELKDFGAFVLPSILYKAAKENYDRGGRQAWEQGLHLCETLLQLNPDHIRTLVLVCKIFIRLGLWSKAEDTLTKLRGIRAVDVPYLVGFKLWKQGKLAEAVVAFRSAIASGHHAPEAYHGLASCLFQLDNLADAEKAVQQGLRHKKINKLLLHVGAQVAIARRKFDVADKYIQSLSRLGEDSDYYHRKATLLIAQNKWREALVCANKAVSEPWPRFEALANRAHILIEVEEFDQALADLQKLDDDFRFETGKQDVKLGLRSKVNLRRNDWRNAEILWDQIADKNRPVHLALRVEILRQSINDPRVSPGEKAKAKAELESIRVSAADTAFVFPEDVADMIDEDDDEAGNDE